jgi:hypothetical protein
MGYRETDWSVYLWKGRNMLGDVAGTLLLHAVREGARRHAV